MAYDYISRGKAKENGYTNTRVFKMFGVSSTGYYNYVSRREDRDGKQAVYRAAQRGPADHFGAVRRRTERPGRLGGASGPGGGSCLIFYKFALDQCSA